MAAYIRKGFSASRKPDYECDCHEVLVLKVCGKHSNFYLFSIYRNHDADDEIFDCLLNSMASIQENDSVTLPILESYLNWVADPMPPPTRRLDDLTSPASSENTPPIDSSRQLPRRLRPHRIRKKQSASSANENAASRVADPAIPLGPSANENSASSAVTRPRSTANRNSPFPGSQSGTSQPPRSALKKHLQTFHPSQQPQYPRSTTNENSERRPRLDHPEIRGVYKPAQHSIRQDTLTSIHRGSFSGSDPSSPALQRLHRGSFSESPSGQLNEKSLTDSGEERIVRGQRSVIVYPLPRAARPDTQLIIDPALPEAAALHHTEPPPTVLDIPEPRQLEETRCPGPSQTRGSRSPRRQSRKRPRNRSSGVFRPKKGSPHRGHWCE